MFIVHSIHIILIPGIIIYLSLVFFYISYWEIYLKCNWINSPYICHLFSVVFMVDLEQKFDLNLSPIKNMRV